MLGYLSSYGQFQTSTISSSPLKCIFFKGNVGWIGTEDGKVYKTTDDGCTWTSQEFLPGIKINILSVFFTSPDTGYFGGYATSFSTYDAGATYTPFYPASLGIIANGIYFPSRKIGYIAGNDGVIMKTTDAGVSWSQLNSGVSHHLQSVFFVGQDTGWVVGNNGTVRKTTDGGATWKAQNNNNFTGTFYSVYFSNARHGVRAGENEFYHVTHDGGETWEGGGILSLSPSIRSVKLLDDSIGYLVGDNGFLQKTIDGGATWTTIPTNTFENLTDIFIADKDHVYAVGDAGTFLKLSTCITLGVATLEKGSKPTLFPNPVASFQDISLNNAENMLLQVYDQTGKQHMVTEINAGVAKINMSTYMPGIYLFRFSNDSQRFTEKVVVH